MKALARALTAVGVGLAISTTAVITATVAAAPAVASTTDNKIRIVQHNTDMGGYQSAVRRANEWGDVDALAFQEICESQKLQAEAEGWKVHWVSQRDVTPSCPPTAQGSTRKGLAIFAQPGRVDTASYDTKWLLTYNGRAFYLICARLTNTGVPNTWLCTAHFAQGDDAGTPGSELRSQMSAKISAYLDGWVAEGKRVVLTGDFNAFPNTAELGPLYRVQGSGFDTDKFWEGDQADVCTGLCRDMAFTTDNNKKLDYFFASWRGVNPNTGMVKTLLDSATSGHHIVRGQVTFGAL
jgi:exonuclease III